MRRRYCIEVSKVDTLGYYTPGVLEPHVDVFQWRWCAWVCRALYILHGRFPDGTLWVPSDIYEVYTDEE